MHTAQSSSPLDQSMEQSMILLAALLFQLVLGKHLNDDNFCQAADHPNTNLNDELSIHCSGLDYSVYYNVGYDTDTTTLNYVDVALFCGQDCDIWLTSIEPEFSANFSGSINASWIANQTNCTVMGCYEASAIDYPTFSYTFASATCQIETTTSALEGTSEVTSEVTTIYSEIISTSDTGTEDTSTVRGKVTTFTIATSTSTLPAVISIVTVFILLLIIIGITLIVLFQIKLRRDKGFRKHTSELYYLKSWSLYDDEFDDQFQPSVELELSKILSESQPSIHCALYEHTLVTSKPWMQENLIKTNSYLELPLPQSPSSRMDDTDDNSSGSSSNSSTPRNISHVSLNVTCASNGQEPLHLDKREHYSALGYCNEDRSVAEEETACDRPFRRDETTHLSVEELIELSTHDAQVTTKNQSYTENLVELCTSNSEIISMNSSETVNTDHAVMGNHEGYVKHNSMSVELNRATPISFDMGTISTNSIQNSPAEEPPTSPIVSFDFGISTLNLSPAQSPDVILTLEENENEVAFNFGSSHLEPNEDLSDVSDRFHLPKGFTSPVATLYPATANGYVVDMTHHTNAFFDFCNNTRCDRSDLYFFDKDLGDSDQLSPSLSKFSLSQRFFSTSSGVNLPFFTSLVRSGYVSKDSS